MKTIWIIVLLLVVTDSAGNVFLTKGMKQVGEVESFSPKALIKVCGRAISNPMLGLGIFCMAVAFFSFLTLLNKADLSFVLPVTALGYAISVLGAKYFLKEEVTATRWLGTVFICAGVALISLY
ncbi:MAG TPA: EamA family transporter [Blastocatellia bacterium]|nr:EamA family transporter [Blastocatellia bacterium]